jgi:hypothetical protein
MRWLLLALCACNRVLGLDGVGVRDARFFDGLGDAQPVCPTMLGVVPQFSATIHQIIDQPCRDYTIGGGIAVAWCSGSISQGPVDGTLVPALGGFPAPTMSTDLDNPRLAPEGDVLYFEVFDYDLIVNTYYAFTRTGDMWQMATTLPLPQYGSPSVPSRAPQRHLLFVDFLAREVSEWAEDSGSAWHQIRTYHPDLTVQHAWLAADGLRALVAGYLASGPFEVEYMDRANIDDPFSTPVLIPSLPPTADLFITSDCTRAYMSSVNSIFYATQI